MARNMQHPLVEAFPTSTQPPDKSQEIAALRARIKELEGALEKAVQVERDQCAAIAFRMHGCDGDHIANAIRARSALTGKE